MTNLNTLATEVFEANKAKGFWENPRPLTETTMLIVTELAEAVEEERAGRPGVYYRASRPDEHLLPEYEPKFVRIDRATSLVRPDWAMDSDNVPPLKPEGVDVELIDSLIRLLDLLGSRGTDVEGLLRQKLAFNASRPRRHGKAY